MRAHLLVLLAVGLASSAVMGAFTAGDASLGLALVWQAPTWALLIAGTIGWSARPANPRGMLMTVAGFASIPGRAVLESSDPALFTLGILTFNAPFAPLAHMIITSPGGRLSGTWSRRAVVLVYVHALIVSPVAALVTVPADWGCNGCPASLNALWIDTDPSIATGLPRLQLAGSILLAGWIAAIVVQRRRRATGPAVRLMPPVVAGCTVGAAALIGLNLAEAADGDQSRDGLAAVGLAIALVPLVVLAGLLRTRATGSTIRQLVVELGNLGPTADLRRHLARALGDRSLEVGYWVPGRREFVDGAGAPLELPDDASRASTVVGGGDDPLAVLIHDPALRDDIGLVETVAAAARIALERERLQVAVRGQLASVRESRSRIVETGDAERRRIERNLHDGAQQRLVSLTLTLRLLAAQAQDAGEPDVAAGLEAAAVNARSAVEELRELGSGLHPTILTEAGVAAAIEAVAESVDVPVALGPLTAERYAESVELGIYHTVSEALTNAVRYAGASRVSVRAHADGRRLLVEVADDGIGGARVRTGGGLRGLVDRIEALAGRFELDSPPGRGTRVRATIPTGGDDARP